MKLYYYAPIVLGVLALSACSRGGGNQTPEAVRQGVMDYLSKRSDLDLNQMQVDVSSVSFRQNEADAVVAFRPKGSATGGMQMRYTLEREGNRWVVKGRGQSPSGAMPHSGQPQGSGMGMPPANPQGGGMGMGGAMPPGHPPVGAGKPAQGSAAPPNPSKK